MIRNQSTATVQGRLWISTFHVLFTTADFIFCKSGVLFLSFFVLFLASTGHRVALKSAFQDTVLQDVNIKKRGATLATALQKLQEQIKLRLSGSEVCLLVCLGVGRGGTGTRHRSIIFYGSIWYYQCHTKQQQQNLYRAPVGRAFLYRTARVAGDKNKQTVKHWGGGGGGVTVGWNKRNKPSVVFPSADISVVLWKLELVTRKKEYATSGAKAYVSSFASAVTSLHMRQAVS